MQLGYIEQSLHKINLRPLPREPYHGLTLQGLMDSSHRFDDSIKCSCSSWGWGTNHLYELRRQLQMSFRDAFAYSRDGVGISQFEGN